MEIFQLSVISTFSGDFPIEKLTTSVENVQGVVANITAYQLYWSVGMNR